MVEAFLTEVEPGPAMEASPQAKRRRVIGICDVNSTLGSLLFACNPCSLCNCNNIKHLAVTNLCNPCNRDHRACFHVSWRLPSVGREVLN
jgi:hypothetical protein